MMSGFVQYCPKSMQPTVGSPGGSKESDLRAKTTPEKGGRITEDNKGEGEDS